MVKESLVARLPIPLEQRIVIGNYFGRLMEANREIRVAHGVDVYENGGKITIITEPARERGPQPELQACEYQALRALDRVPELVNRYPNVKFDSSTAFTLKSGRPQITSAPIASTYLE